MSEALLTGSLAGPIALACIAIPALVVSDFRGFRAGRLLFKPLAALAFIWLAITLNATDSLYGQWLLAGLFFCLLGDLLLMPDHSGSFLAGLLAFLIGHLLYVVAFVQLGNAWNLMLLTGVPALLLLVLSTRWLMPHVQPEMKLPVRSYIVVITGMLLAAGLTGNQPAGILVIIGAWGFALSDLAVARQRFVQPGPLNGLWGTPLYFFSQMLLAGSLALV
ncbi:MAG: lysoplasmalogenase [Halieaceae bacterium]